MQSFVFSFRVEYSFIITQKLPFVNAFLTVIERPKDSRTATVIHEMAHRMKKTGGWDALAKYVHKVVGEEQFNAIRENYKKSYDDWRAEMAQDNITVPELSEEQLDEEAVADALAYYLKKVPYLENKASKGFIKKAFASIVSIVKMIKNDGFATYRAVMRIQSAYEKMLTAVEADQARRDAEKILAEYDKMYSLEKTTTGIPVAVVDDDILSGIYAGTWDDQTLKKAIKAAKAALLKFNQGIAVRGITIKVNLTSREEYTKSNYSKTIEKRMPDVYADKLRASSAASDVVIAATNWSQDGGLKHPRSDNFVDFQRGQTLIMAGAKQYTAEVVVGITNNGEYVFYDVVGIKPTQFVLAHSPRSGKNNNGDLPSVTPDKPFDTALKVSNDDSISHSPSVVNSEFEEIDKTYLEAVNRGDMETAQRMVDDAAKEAGYSRRMYHGAKKGGGFTVFKDWQYFTENKAYAERYTSREAPNSLYTVYIKAEHTFDTRDPDTRKIFNSARGELGLTELQDSGLPDWTDGYDLAEYIEENDLDYDFIVLDEGGDMVNGKPVSRGLSYVVRNSAQIKSADPVTYDDNGNIIPLSKRFDSGNPDIRYSPRESASAPDPQNPYDHVDTTMPKKEKLTRAEARLALKEFFESAQIELTNQQAGIENFLVRVGKMKKAEAAAYVQAVRTSEAYGIGAVTTGQYSADGKRVGDGLFQILSPLWDEKNETWDEKLFHEFSVYITNLHNIDRQREDKPVIPYTNEEIRKKVTLRTNARMRFI